MSRIVSSFKTEYERKLHPTQNAECTYITVPTSLVCSGGLSSGFHTEQTQCAPAGGPRGSTFCLLTGFLLKSSVYHSFVFYHFSVHWQQPWWSRVLHQQLVGTEHFLYHPQKVQGTTIPELQLHAEVSTCPFHGSEWLIASAFRRGSHHIEYRASSCLTPCSYWVWKRLLNFFTSVLSATPHKEMNCCLFRYGNVQLWVSLSSWVQEGRFCSKCQAGRDVYLVNLSLYLVIFHC